MIRTEIKKLKHEKNRSKSNPNDSFLKSLTNCYIFRKLLESKSEKRQVVRKDRRGITLDSVDTKDIKKYCEQSLHMSLIIIRYTDFWKVINKKQRMT